MEWKALVALIGNADEAKTCADLKKALARRAQYVAQSLLSVGKAFSDAIDAVKESSLLPVGARFAECYAQFNLHVNTQLLARPDVQRTHAIDGKTVPLLDC